MANKLSSPFKMSIGVTLLATWYLLTPSARAQDTTASLYKTKCAVCHGADGNGETTIGKATKIRPLNSADVQKQSDADMSGIITNGKNKMPAYGKSLKPEQVKELVAYIRSLPKK